MLRFHHYAGENVAAPDTDGFVNQCPLVIGEVTTRQGRVNQLGEATDQWRTPRTSMTPTIRRMRHRACPTERLKASCAQSTATTMELARDSDRIRGILRRTLLIEQGSLSLDEPTPRVIGLLAHGLRSWDLRAAELAAARLNAHLVHLGWDEPTRTSLDDLITEAIICSNAADAMLVGFVDTETLGGGVTVTNAVAEHLSCLSVVIRNEVYADVAALTHLSLIRDRLGSLNDAKITVSWAFGDRFDTPGTVHSLLMLAPALGARVSVVAPPRFGPLRRVVREAERASGQDMVEVVESEEWPEAIPKSDAMIALNWRSLDEFDDVERNREMAAQYRDWYFTRSSIPDGTLFLTEPPVRAEMAADQELLSHESNLTPLWLQRSASVLASAILDVVGNRGMI